MAKDKFDSPAMDKLFEAILALESVDECYAFFEDLCTINEMNSLAGRLQVAQMLKDGRTYTSIEEETGVSTATISRVKRFLQYGGGGYNLILERIKRK